MGPKAAAARQSFAAPAFRLFPFDCQTARGLRFSQRSAALLFVEARARPVLLTLPPENAGERSAERRGGLRGPLGGWRSRPARLRGVPSPPCDRRRGASRRSTGGVFLTAPGRAFGAGSRLPPRWERRLTGSPSASSWQGAVVPPGGAPTPPECGVTSPARGRRASRFRVAPDRPGRTGAASPAPFLPPAPSWQRPAKTPPAEQG